MCRLSLVVVRGGYSSLWCPGFSLRWVLLWNRSSGFSSFGSWALERRLGSWGSWALERRFSSSCAGASLFHSMRHHPRPGIEPMPPASAGGFSSAEPPGPSLVLSFGVRSAGVGGVESGQQMEGKPFSYQLPGLRQRRSWLHPGHWLVRLHFDCYYPHLGAGNSTHALPCPNQCHL